MPSAIDTFVAYKFIKQLSMPWTRWDAYKLGLIDKNGQRIRKAETKEEKRKFPLWQRLIRNLKLIIDKVPFGKTRLGSFASALWFLKEEMKVEDVKVLENALTDYLSNQKKMIIEEENQEKINTLVKGRYRIKATNDIVFIKETNSFVEILGEPLFEIHDQLKDRKMITALSELEEF